MGSTVTVPLKGRLTECTLLGKLSFQEGLKMIVTSFKQGREVLTSNPTNNGEDDFYEPSPWDNNSRLVCLVTLLNSVVVNYGFLQSTSILISVGGTSDPEWYQVEIARDVMPENVRALTRYINASL